MSIDVKIEIFEGPFDLLLQLILRHELNVHEVPIAQITESYLENIESAHQIDLDSATEFLVIAATLLLIKTRSLLPATDEEPDFLQETEAARELLIEQLLEYKKFSNAAQWLEEVYSREGWYIPRMRELEEDYSYLYPDPFENVPVSMVSQVLLELMIANTSRKVDISYIAPIKVSVSKHIDRVRKSVSEKQPMRFSELVRDCTSKLDVIATFLALLELYKRGEISLSQRKTFGEINVKKRKGEKSSVA